MTDYPERIPPLAVEDFTAEQAELVGDWTHLAFSRVIVRHPAAYRIFLPYIDKVIRGSNLPPRDREVIVLRLLGLCDEVYELHHHEMIARNAGMNEAEIAAAKAGEGAGLSSFDLVLCRNVMIYFNQNLQNDVLKKFHESLFKYGYLAIGSKESLIWCDYANRFIVVNNEEKVYKKIKD